MLSTLELATGCGQHEAGACGEVAGLPKENQLSGSEGCGSSGRGFVATWSDAEPNLNINPDPNLSH